MLLYVWGHSYELDENNGWTLLEDFCRRLGGQTDIWYATNIEIYDYRQACARLEFSADADRVYNPSCRDCWLYVDGQTVRAAAGQTTPL